eukprot:TRINITY_DN13076_c0_g1_i1.p1 TRINITY_DN13076_c0_g1~~TRINITY_DN13076_c0_g1_i1.p1  ORF type:complete len:476 (+),score=168.73 TRINITY_DN13076_c0_g1_i1:69-1496(+)
MPPKRKRAADLANESKPTDEESPPKKQKLMDTKQSSSTDLSNGTKINSDKNSTKNDPESDKEVDNSDAESSEDDGKPICWYDENCYRQNPSHFVQFRHPKKTALEKKSKKEGASASSSQAIVDDEGSQGSQLTKKASTLQSKTKDADETSSSSRPALKRSNSSVSQPDLTSGIRPGLELYKAVMKVQLNDNKIGVEGKKLLKKFRQEHSVTEHEHDQLLGLFGWTPDEYEEGERAPDDIDLDREKEILKNDNGFKVIELRNGQKMTKEEQNVWDRVCSKFFQTMAKSQANYAIKAIGIVVNTKLKRAYDDKKKKFTNSDKTKNKEHSQEIWGFHGTSEHSVQCIIKDGFKHPDDLKKAEDSKTKNKKKAKAKKGVSVELLDDGYFGKGIYFALYSDYAMWYSEERNSTQLIMAKILTGKSFKCTGRMDGQDHVPGYDSHYSPKGNEVIVFESGQCLPRYVVTFEEREAQEREQED